jgi:tyrosine decarboxylase/aspartate 1-decarboxylase
MEQKGVSREEVEVILQAALDKDIKFDDGRILCSMNASAHDLSRLAHSMFIEANLGNPRLYPGTKELEEQVIAMLAGLLNGENVQGNIVNGGTEANITALWLARKLSGKSEVIFPKSAHFSIDKAADLLGLKPVKIDLDENYRMDLGSLETKLSENTAAVVAIAGTTEFGVIDPIEDIAALTSDKCFLHVDAAFGGMVIPFLKDLGYEMPPFDFEIPSVDSIAIDPHKMGSATIPAGALLFRESHRLENIAVDTPYLTSTRQAALVGTRNSAGVAGAFAVMRLLGREGYRKIVNECMEITMYFKNLLEESGFELVIEPVMNVLAVKVPEPAKIEKELAEINWWVSKTREPEALRFVVMPYVTKQVVDNFMPDLISVCKKNGII